jgi:hypothetical protein
MPQTVLDSPASVARDSSLSRSTLWRLAALTPVVLFIHGYHPFADDAGIYVAGIRKLLHPALYQIDAPFVLANTRLSIFAHLVAWADMATHLPLSILLLTTYLVSIYLLLLACWGLACRIFEDPIRRWSAVLWVAVCFTLPAAGTAIELMDPYVTSRSFSTPLGLFAVAAAIDRRWVRAALLILFVAVMHPLMVIYAAGFVIFYGLVDGGRVREAILLGIAGIGAFAVLVLFTRHAPISQAYRLVMSNRNRTFLFPRLWKWYEDFGLAAPLAIYAIALKHAKRTSVAGKLCVTAILLGISSATAAFLFVHADGPYFTARLQLLRSFHLIYLLGVILAGGWLGKFFVAGGRSRWAVVAAVIGVSAIMFTVQRATYPLSAHIEWPGMAPRNPWEQAYQWVRSNTPADAVFAANPELLSLYGVDAQGFRATTRRSILADDKDQGVAAVVDPAISGEWMAQRNAQLGLDQMSDEERMLRLRPFGVTWLLLPSDAATNFSCPYRNAAAKVCVLED